MYHISSSIIYYPYLLIRSRYNTCGNLHFDSWIFVWIPIIISWNKSVENKDIKSHFVDILWGNENCKRCFIVSVDLGSGKVVTYEWTECITQTLTVLWFIRSSQFFDTCPSLTWVPSKILESDTENSIWDQLGSYVVQGFRFR